MKMLSDHFAEAEFRCKCCGQVHPAGMDTKLIKLLESIRAKASEILGKDAPVHINSGYRCNRHNEALRKDDPSVARTSQHLLGTAADIVVEGLTPQAVAAIAEKLLPRTGGIGRYPSFTHVDVRRNCSRWNGK